MATIAPMTHIITGITHPKKLSQFPKHALKTKSSSYLKTRIIKCEIKQVERGPQKSRVDIKKLVGFLHEDLPHLFDEKGIDPRAYDPRVMFRDPITKHDTISGYLFNISLLKLLFTPRFFLHWVKQTGPYEITTRWTMVMRFILVPWKPELVFTGTSVMGVNPNTGKFCSHVDYWDSIKSNDYFSLEGLWDVFRQLRIYKTPDLETPKYEILKRAADYEVRRYEPFIVAETDSPLPLQPKGTLILITYQLSAISLFHNNMKRKKFFFFSSSSYIFGKNSKEEKIPMTTPVFTETNDGEDPKVAIQIVLPQDKDLSSLPNPNQDTIRLRKVEGGIAAALKFSGKPTEDVVRIKERDLRSSVIRDGLKPRKGCFFARYNDPGRTWDFIMRNEVLIWLEDFSME